MSTDRSPRDDGFDVIVLGGGPAGENAAAYARTHDLEVALVEHELVGGECTYWACMPSKALLRPGDALAAVRRVPGAAPAVTGDLDVEATFRSRDAFTSGWDDEDQVAWLESAGTTLVRGHGRLAGDRTVEVALDEGGTRTLTARRGVVVATGSVATSPPIDGLDEVEAWDSRDVTSVAEVPGRLLVLGGGVVGVEMAQAYQRLGAEVTVVESADRLLAAEEPFVGEELAEAFDDAGIRVLVGRQAQHAARDDEGAVTLSLDDGTEVVGDELVVATGRRPATAELGLETVGLEPGAPLDTDEQLRVVGVEGGWLYAVGDVNGRAPLTHHGKYQARLVGDHLAGRDVAARADHDAFVRVVFTDPQVAAVGPTLAAAREAGRDVVAVHTQLGDVAGAMLLGRGVGGTAQLVVDREGRTVLGATFTGPGVGEMLHAATIAVVSGITLEALWHAVPAFPTVSEVWLRLLETDRGV